MTRWLALTLTCLLLGACSLWPARPPLAGVSLGTVVEGELELQAVLQLDYAGESHQYLLALNVQDGQAQLALLTAQGAPLYSIAQAAGDTRSRRQLGAPPGLPADALLGYIALAYAAPARLAAQLDAAGLSLRLQGDTRNYSGARGEPVITVEYFEQGVALPAAQLVDRPRDLRLHIRPLADAGQAVSLLYGRAGARTDSPCTT